MGFNTTIIVRNDATGDIASDLQFGKRLADAISQQHMMSEGIDVAAHNGRGGVSCNAASVIEQHHADETAIIAVGGNYGTKLCQIYGHTHHTEEDKLRLVREMASHLGYNLVQKPKRSKRNGAKT